MSEPKIAAKQPIAANLEAGKTYYWCRCGHSQGQPFCDGSHKGTGFQPLAVQVNESKQAKLCQCKHTKNPPYCDGTHRTL